MPPTKHEDDDWLGEAEDDWLTGPSDGDASEALPSLNKKLGDICAHDLSTLTRTDQARVAYVLAASGVKHETILKVLGVSESTLYRHFREELDQGKGLATASVAFSLFETALYETDARARVTAGIFWLKARAGWKETTVIEQPNTGKQIDFSRLTKEEAREAERILEKAYVVSGPAATDQVH